jgi:hypothetical protein
MYTINVAIQGVAPGLLMHKFSAGDEAGLQSAVKVKSARKPTAEESAAEAAYRDETGQLVQPGEHIYQALVKASGSFQVQGRGKKSYKDAVKGNVIVVPDYIPHQQTGYDIDLRPVRIQAARVMRARPWLKNWALSFQVQVLDEAMLPFEVLNAILVDAGEKVGIGDYRPRFGRFTVTRFEKA